MDVYFILKSHMLLFLLFGFKPGFVLVDQTGSQPLHGGSRPPTGVFNRRKRWMLNILFSASVENTVSLSRSLIENNYIYKYVLMEECSWHAY